MITIVKNGKCYIGDAEYLAEQGFTAQEIEAAQWQESQSSPQVSA